MIISPDLHRRSSFAPQSKKLQQTEIKDNFLFALNGMRFAEINTNAHLFPEQQPKGRFHKDQRRWRQHNGRLPERNQKRGNSHHRQGFYWISCWNCRRIKHVVPKRNVLCNSEVAEFRITFLHMGLSGKTQQRGLIYPYQPPLPFFPCRNSNLT